MRRFLPILLLLIAVVAAPILLRRQSDLAGAQQNVDRLVIISPHNETIRHEFGEAFARHWKATRGRALYIDWRIPGGTSDIRRVVNSSFLAAKEVGREGIGIDIFFGGGDPDFKGQAEAGHLAKLEVFERHPEWFQPEVIPAKFTGENYFDGANRMWVGTCLSQMGICYNRDSIRRLGVAPPQRWEDLGDPVYAGYVALADPTKSGSVLRSYEMIVQEQMQGVIRESGADTPAAREEGWRRALNLLQRMAANARYFTEAANKVPHDVAQGDAAAGTCIDFYGRSYEEKLQRQGEEPRLRWVAPQGGTSLSVDPVAVFRGAPHAETAQEFVNFCLSAEGQLLWNLKVGQPGGPTDASPRRLPVRRDLYTPERLQGFSDPAALPYEKTGGFEYKRELTGSAFTALGGLIRAMCMDPHEEMKEAWREIRRHTPAGTAPEDTEAGKVFFDVSFLSYDRMMKEIAPLVARKNPLATMQEMSRIAGRYRENYLRAAEIARKGGQP